MMKSYRLLASILFCSVGAVATGCYGNSESLTETAPLPGPIEELEYRAPEGWVEETPSSAMRRGQYRLPRAEGDHEDAEVAVFYFEGQGGSVQANVDRWLGQFTKEDGSPADDVAQVSRRQVDSLQVTVVDVSGTYQPAMGPMTARTEPRPHYRMLAAVVETPGGPWFFRLTGPERTVSQWEESFHSFLEGIRLTGRRL